MLRAPGLIVAASLVALVGSATGEASALEAARLRCEYLENPLGIDVLRPRFTWELRGARRAERQTAYRILVASSPDTLARGRGDLWDTGRIVGASCVPVTYAGRALASRERAHWTVQIWDGDGMAGSFAAAAWFEMGLLHAEDWKARWIRAKWSRDEVEPWPPMDAAVRWIGSGAGAATRRYRVRFELPCRAQRAQLLLAGGEVCTPFVNGHELPRVQAGPYLAAIDVDEWLVPGPNVLALEVEEGRGPPGALARLAIGLEGGSERTIDTNADWQVAAAAAPGWTRPEFDAAKWARAAELGAYGDPPWGLVRLPVPDDPAPWFRRQFVLSQPVRSARVSVCGLGLHELWLNDARVGDHRLDPAFTRYDERVLVVTHDVTSLVQPGSNVLGVVLGHGFYDAWARDAWGFERAAWRARPRLLCQLDVSYVDGTRTTIASDESWTAEPGPILFDGIRNGETFDAVRYRSDWATPYARSRWRPLPVRLAAPPSGSLAAQMLPPIRVQEVLQPVGVRPAGGGVVVYDFGRSIAGWARLRVAGRRGARVVLRYGERLDREGRLDVDEIGQFVLQGPFQTDAYHLGGGGLETWEPRFTYHGFRYVEVACFPADPDTLALEAVAVRTDFERIGDFACGDSTANALFRAAVRSYENNFQGLPTDCPHREKNGWTADAHLAANFGMLVFDNAAGYTKWTGDLLDAQRPTGELPGIVPSGGWGYEWGNGPAWDAALFLVPWSLYRHRGDVRVLEQCFDAWGRSLDHFARQDDFVTPPKGWLGERGASRGSCPDAVVHAIYHAEACRIAAGAAGILGRPVDAARWASQADAVRQQLYARYYDRRAHAFAGGSHTAQACAVGQGAAREEDAAAIVERLARDVRAADGRLDCGVLGARHVLRVLADHGEVDLAWRLLTRTDAPGWGSWIAAGATTLWEDWGRASSHDHAWFADAGAWLLDTVAGIRQSPEGPPERLVIRPRLPTLLPWARGETRIPNGRVSSGWKKIGRGVTFEIEIPAGATAEVHLPAARRARVTEGGARADRAVGVRFLRRERGAAVYETGSGKYSFRVE